MELRAPVPHRSRSRLADDIRPAPFEDRPATRHRRQQRTQVLRGQLDTCLWLYDKRPSSLLGCVFLAMLKVLDEGIEDGLTAFNDRSSTTVSCADALPDATKTLSPAEAHTLLMRIEATARGIDKGVTFADVFATRTASLAGKATTRRELFLGIMTAMQGSR